MGNTIVLMIIKYFNYLNMYFITYIEVVNYGVKILASALTYFHMLCSVPSGIRNLVVRGPRVRKLAL